MAQENTQNLKKSAFSGFAWKFAERICAQGVSLVVSVILARLLLPDDYAIVGIVAIFFTFCNVFISGGLNTALIQKKDADELDYNTILYISLALAIVIYAIMFVVAPFIADAYGISLIATVIRVMGLTLIINAVKSILCAYVSNKLEFRKFFLSTIGGTVVSAVVGIYMAVSGFGVWALVAQQMSNSLIDTLILFISTRFRVKLIFSYQRFKSLFSYGWKILVTSIITTIYDETNPLIVGLKFSPVDLSFYTKGKSFPSLINTTVSNSLSSVLFPVMAKMQDSKEAILSVTRKYIKVSSYLMFPIMCGFFAVSDSFVRLLLTEKWMAAVPYIRIFCITYMFDMIQIGNLHAIKAIGRSDINLILEIVKKVSYFIIIAAFVFFTDSPIALAVSAVFCTLVATIVNTFPNRKLIGYRYRYQVMDILPNLVISMIMCVVVVCMNSLPLSPMWMIICQIIAGVVIYIFLSVVTKNENFTYLLKTAKQFFKK